MEYREMIVEGVAVPGGTQELAASDFLHSIATRGAADFTTLQVALIRRGVDAGVAYRAADRLAQRMRKSGLIRFNGKAWVAA